MSLERATKTAMIAMVAGLAWLVVLNNLTDYGTNFAYVRHVLSMDALPAEHPLRWRAMALPWQWSLAYAVIIFGEAVVALLFTVGVIALLRHQRAAAAVFQTAKRWIHAGALAAMSVWFFGFMVVGGEWFQMWQSPEWNGQQAAFRVYITALLVALYVCRCEGD